MTDYYLRPSKEAFNDALMNDIFNGDPQSPHYVGNWMYMGTEKRENTWFDVFKHFDTREYLRTPYEKEPE